jgi:hypothetical protein
MAGSRRQIYREDHAPANLSDLIDRHICRATDSDTVLRRYRRLFWGLCLGSVVVLLTTASVMIAVSILLTQGHVSPWFAVGLGAAGGTAVVQRAALTARKALFVGGIRSRGDHERPADLRRLR